MAVWHQAGGGPALVVVTVEVDRRIYDPFGRTESSSWGSTDTDEAWTTTGGSASDYSVTGGVGIQSMGSVSVTRQSELPIVVADLDVVFTTGISAAPTGDTVEQSIALRWVDSNNYVDFRIFRESGGSVTCAIRQVIAGSETASGFPTIAGVTSGSDIRIRFECSGSTIRGRAWLTGTTEPSTWDQTMTTDHLAPGALRLRSTLGGSVSNSLPLLIDFDDLLATIPDQRIEVAPLHVTGLSLEMAGRQTEVDRADNAVASLTLDNSAGTYTPGYLYAPYELKQGQRIWVKETVGRRSWDLFTGTLQQPEARYGEHQNDARVLVSAVDSFAEQESNGRTFISTLGEYIRYTGGTSLVGYWPLGEQTGASQSESEVTGQTALSVQRRTDYDGSHAPPLGLLTFGGEPGPPMDDIQAVSFQPLRTPTLAIARDRLRTSTLAAVDFADAETVAFSLWYMMSPDFTGGWSDQAMVTLNTGLTNSITIQTVAAVWTAYFQTDAGSATVSGSAARAGIWQLLTVHLNIATGVSSFWIDKQQYLGDVGGASTGTLDAVTVDGTSPGSAACHLQVYAGPASVVNRQLHLDQYAQGTDEYVGGLRFQRTDERFRTLCRYAGMPEPDCDYGTVWMPAAELAGATLTGELAEVVETEQGRGYVSGGGVPTFHSRIRTRYNL